MKSLLWVSLIVVVGFAGCRTADPFQLPDASSDVDVDGDGDSDTDTDSDQTCIYDCVAFMADCINGSGEIVQDMTCPGSQVCCDFGSDSDTDSDTDTDVDTDTDIDTDSDTDVDTDTDTDIDTDTDSDTDGDTDTDTDSDTDSDTDGDTETSEFDTCTNIALDATPYHSGGGVEELGYGPSEMNDGNLESACEYTWVMAGSVPDDDYIRYNWPTEQTLHGMWIDTVHWDEDICVSVDGRSLAGGSIEYWNGSAWATDGVVSDQSDDWGYVFDPPVVTDNLRVYGVHATTLGTQDMNPIIFEWEVYSCGEVDTDSGSDSGTDTGTDTGTDSGSDTGSDTGTDGDPLVVTFWEQMWSGVDYNQHRLLIGPSSSTNPEENTWTVLADGAAMDNPLWDSSFGWVQGFVADITGWSGDEVRFAFHFLGQDADKWYIDDICMGWGDGPGNVPSVCLWEEGCEDPGYPEIPTGWTSVAGSANDSASNDWRTSIDQFHSGSTSALVDGRPATWNVDRYLVSPPVTLP